MGSVCMVCLVKKTVGDRTSCSFRHPKKCTKYCQFGTEPSYGCTNPECNCKFLHPILCRYSVISSHCNNDSCTYTHLKGTKRKSQNQAITNQSKGQAIKGTSIHVTLLTQGLIQENWDSIIMDKTSSSIGKLKIMEIILISKTGKMRSSNTVYLILPLLSKAD